MTTLESSSINGFPTMGWVIYPPHGLGRITGVKKDTVANEVLEFLEIRIESSKLLVLVPAHKANSSKLRQLVTPKVAIEAIDILCGGSDKVFGSRRKQHYLYKVNSGDMISLAEVVRDLYWGQKKEKDTTPSQSYTERCWYQDSLQRFVEEISALTKTKEAEIIKNIEAILENRGDKVVTAKHHTLLTQRLS